MNHVISKSTSTKTSQSNAIFFRIISVERIFRILDKLNNKRWKSCDLSEFQFSWWIWFENIHNILFTNSNFECLNDLIFEFTWTINVSWVTNSVCMCKLCIAREREKEVWMNVQRIFLKIGPWIELPISHILRFMIWHCIRNFKTMKYQPVQTVFTAIVHRHAIHIRPIYFHF